MKAKTYTHDGETLSLAEWSARVKIKSATLATRLRCGWTLEAALTTRVGPPLYTLEGRSQNLKAWAREYALPYGRVYERIRAGRTLLDALIQPSREAVPPPAPDAPTNHAQVAPTAQQRAWLAWAMRRAQAC